VQRRLAALVLVAVLLAPLIGAVAGPVPAFAQSEDTTHTPEEVSRAAANLLFQEQGVYGVVFMETDGTVLYKRNADLPFVAASLYKLIVMVDFYAARERGDLTFDDFVELQYDFFSVFENPDEGEDAYYGSDMVGTWVTIGELMTAMITYSSNVAARALLSMTSPETLNWIAGDLGMSGTYLLMPLEDVSPWPPVSMRADNLGESEEALRFISEWGSFGNINITTPADIATFFMMLANGNVVSPEASQEMIELLEQQTINDRMPFFLPEGTRCPHKTGNLEHVVHDAGIVFGDRGPTIMVALSEAVTDDERAMYVIQRLGLIAYGESELPPIPPSSATPSPEAED
jgi:beta-lactamase class A